MSALYVYSTVAAAWHGKRERRLKNSYYTGIVQSAICIYIYIGILIEQNPEGLDDPIERR